MSETTKSTAFHYSERSWTSTTSRVPPRSALSAQSCGRPPRGRVPGSIPWVRTYPPDSAAVDREDRLERRVLPLIWTGIRFSKTASTHRV